MSKRSVHPCHRSAHATEVLMPQKCPCHISAHATEVPMSKMSVRPCHRSAHVTEVPMPQKCPYHRSAHATEVPMPQKCPCHRSAHATEVPMPRARNQGVAIIPYRLDYYYVEMRSLLPFCPFHCGAITVYLFVIFILLDWRVRCAVTALQY